MSELRPASFGDLSEVVAWIGSAQAARNWAGPGLAYPIDPQKLRQQTQWVEAFSFRLQDERQLIGFGQIVPKPDNRLHLARLIVRPADRSHGYGRTLAVGLLDRALGRAPSVVSLNVFADNTAAVELYRQIGFVAAERLPDAQGSDALAMIYSNRASVP